MDSVLCMSWKLHVEQDQLGARRFGLGHTFGCPADSRHELRAQRKVMRFLGGEPEVSENVSASAFHLELAGHRLVLSFNNARYRFLARAISGLGVR